MTKNIFLWNSQRYVETKNLITLGASDHVTISFQDWFSPREGNTYFDATVRINDLIFQLPSQYGYHQKHPQAVIEALTSIGYRIRKERLGSFANFNRIHTYNSTVKKSELIKTFSKCEL